MKASGAKFVFDNLVKKSKGFTFDFVLYSTRQRRNKAQRKRNEKNARKGKQNG